MSKPSSQGQNYEIGIMPEIDLSNLWHQKSLRLWSKSTAHLRNQI